ncbi:cupin [Microbacterium barkeri]|uniref:Cupin n=1 Tax=Microbacterium barkeri TaxID=33917 RepID=A0A9W6H4H6_9MICO|nr:cupin domain-containing protein [Microbacterium barkeri]MDI6944447.1 cupin domain-containing protein [Microbacterium barkeri]MDR6877524.1 transcriptional regulator with XRE-family HTH domain [Microbacterium barkeri]GLJ62461.1 cupin [Microbacterium barkeri]
MTDAEAIELGARIRDLRSLAGMSTRSLAAKAGVSAGYISQIENGQANASIAVLRSIADAFGIPWLELFGPAPQHGRLLRKADRPKLFSDGHVAHYGITQPPIGNVEVLVSEYEPGQGTGGPDYTHGDSQEVCMVLKGTLQLTVNGESYELGAGDSIEYRTSLPHQIRNVGDTRAEAVWIVTPPSTPNWPARPE